MLNSRIIATSGIKLVLKQKLKSLMTFDLNCFVPVEEKIRVQTPEFIKFIVAAEQKDQIKQESL